MCHLPHCILCLVYSLVGFCPVVSTQCVCLFLHSNLGFQRKRLTALGQVSTHKPLSWTGEFPSASLQLSVWLSWASSPHPRSGSLGGRSLHFSCCWQHTSLSLHQDFCSSSAWGSHCTFLHFHHSGAHGYTFPSILGPVPSVNLHGLPTTCHVNSSLPGLVIQVSGPSLTFKILFTPLLPGTPLPWNQVVFFLSNPFHLWLCCLSLFSSNPPMSSPSLSIPLIAPGPVQISTLPWRVPWPP